MNESPFVRLEHAYPHMIKQKYKNSEEFQMIDNSKVNYLENIVQDVKKFQEKNIIENDVKFKKIEDGLNQLRNKDDLSFIKESLNSIFQQQNPNHNKINHDTNNKIEILSEPSKEKLLNSSFWSNSTNVALIQSIIIGKIFFYYS